MATLGINKENIHEPFGHRYRREGSSVQSFQGKKSPTSLLHWRTRIHYTRTLLLGERCQ